MLTPGLFRKYLSLVSILHGLAKIDIFGLLDDFHNRDTGLAPEPKLTTTANDIRNKPPSAFTGGMARLVQYHYANSPGIVNPYSHVYVPTHGLHIDQNGAPWIIQISTFQGVHARPLAVDNTAAVNTSAPNDTGGFTFTPIIELLPPITDPSWRELAPAAIMAGVTGGPWGNEGWAFNDNGTSAAIVTQEQTNLPVVRTSRLWVVSITGDASGPTLATVANTESGAFGAALDGSQDFHLKFWNQLNDRVQSFSIDFDGASPPGDNVAPIYAYYNNNTLVVTRWHYTAEVTNVLFDNPAPVPDDLSAGSFGSHTETISTRCFSSTEFPVAENRAESRSIVTRTHGDDITGMVDGDLVTVTPVYGETLVGDMLIVNQTVEDVVIIPMRDRSSIYHTRALSGNTQVGPTGGSASGWIKSAGEQYLVDNPPVGSPRRFTYTGPAPPPTLPSIIPGFGPTRTLVVTGPENDVSATQFTATVGGFSGQGASENAAVTAAVDAHNLANPGNPITFQSLNVTSPGNVPGSGTWSADVIGTQGGGPFTVGSVFDYGRDFHPETVHSPGDVTFVDQVNTNTDEKDVVLLNLGGSLNLGTLTIAQFNSWNSKEFSFDGQLITVIQSHGATPRIIYSTLPVEYERRFFGDLVGRYGGAGLYAPAAINAYHISWVGNA